MEFSKPHERNYKPEWPTPPTIYVCCHLQLSACNQLLRRSMLTCSWRVWRTVSSCFAQGYLWYRNRWQR